MNDIELTEEHDLLFTDGDLNLLNNEARVAKQTLKINLLYYKGEWFLDSEFGVPYFQEILKKVNNTALVDNIIQDVARNSYNITKITAFSSSLSNDRKYTVEYLEGTTQDGEIISITNLQV